MSSTNSGVACKSCNINYHCAVCQLRISPEDDWISYAICLFIWSNYRCPSNLFAYFSYDQEWRSPSHRLMPCLTSNLWRLTGLKSCYHGLGLETKVQDHLAQAQQAQAQLVVITIGVWSTVGFSAFLIRLVTCTCTYSGIFRYGYYFAVYSMFICLISSMQVKAVYYYDT